MKKINIIGPNSLYGMTNDINIITSLIENIPVEVALIDTHSSKLFLQIYRWVFYIMLKVFNLDISNLMPKNRPIADINIYLDKPQPFYFSYAAQNILIPNQEYVNPYMVKNMKNIDYVICKTIYAQKLFDQWNVETVFTGYKSKDCFIPKINKDYKRFIHIAGKSPFKGTNNLISVWEQHPEWPELTIIQHPLRTITTKAKNINYVVDEFMPFETLNQFRNEIGIHICLSESEGYGHYIVEAMSCKSVVITTNAPPMNELVNDSRGFLVDFDQKYAVGLGENFVFSKTHLEEIINKIILMDANKLAHLGNQARQYFLKSETSFNALFINIFQKIINY